MNSLDALKAYFGSEKPVTNQELIRLRREDKAGYDELKEACFKAVATNG